MTTEKMKGILRSLGGTGINLALILHLDHNGETSVGKLAEVLGVTPPAISQTLKKMKELDMVRGRREAQTVYYRLNAGNPFFMTLLPIIQMNLRIR